MGALTYLEINKCLGLGDFLYLSSSFLGEGAIKMTDNFKFEVVGLFRFLSMLWLFQIAEQFTTF